MTRLLFVCGKARMRSATAADIFAGHGGIETDFAGLSNDADERLSSEHIEWADVVFVMEQRQKKRLSQLFGAELKGKKVACLNIPDRFQYMQPELVETLNSKLTPYLRRYSQP